MRAYGYTPPSFMVLLVSPVLAVLFLPGENPLVSVPLGVLAAALLVFLPLPRRPLAWLVRHRTLATLIAFAVGCFTLPIEGTDPFKRAWANALLVYVLISLLGASSSGHRDDNVGYAVGALLGGAYGGAIRSLIGFFFGGLIGGVLRKRSGLLAGLIIGTLSSVFLMAPGCEDFGVSKDGIVDEMFERQRASQEAYARGDDYSGPSYDPPLFTWGFLGSIEWLIGIPFGMVIGAILGELAKASVLGVLLGAAQREPDAQPPAEAASPPPPDPQAGLPS